MTPRWPRRLLMLLLILTWGVVTGEAGKLIDHWFREGK